MAEYGEVLLDAFLDSIKVLPILLVVYFLIEFIEYKWAVKLQNNRYLRGNASPAIAALVGSIPQCGFSVVAADLFAQRMVSIGAVVAIFISTSDEALPLLLANPQNWLSIIVLIVAKIIIGIAAGYAANLLYRLIIRRQPAINTPVSATVSAEHSHDDEDHDEHDHDHTVQAVAVHHDGCCHHHLDDKRFNWVHPLLHSLKIFAFIFAVSLLFGMITDIWVGEDNLSAFLTSSFWLQPLFAVVVGLVPNCAASVVLTELYLVGGLRFGALLGGLCVNAGLGLIFLLRQKHIWREKIFIFAWLIVVSLLVGYCFLWLTI
ncbi:MAG: arsenic efflux protein [Clostridia bacterium]|nr:arsenic efflux protein [Clostridia bacterium]